MSENICLCLCPFFQVSIEEFSPTARMTKCPDCDRDIPYAPSPQELEDMMEEARMRILKAQKVWFTPLEPPDHSVHHSHPDLAYRDGPNRSLQPVQCITHGSNAHLKRA